VSDSEFGTSPIELCSRACARADTVEVQELYEALPNHAQDCFVRLVEGLTSSNERVEIGSGPLIQVSDAAVDALRTWLAERKERQSEERERCLVAVAEAAHAYISSLGGGQGPDGPVAHYAEDALRAALDAYPRLVGCGVIDAYLRGMMKGHDEG
jgi:hypothetical protein